MDKVIQNFGKGEVIIPEGSRGDRSYRIMTGEVLICKQNAQGKTVPIARLHEGELFGEMYLFSPDGTRSASAIASDNVQLEVLFAEDLQQELAALPAEIQQLLGTFNERLQNTTGGFASLFQEKVLLELPDGTLRVADSAR